MFTCYQFVHACESPLIYEITRIIGKERYFLVCQHHLNYFYCNDFASVQMLFELLEDQGIFLQEIEETQLLTVIDSQHMQNKQEFHGSAVLLNKFREKSEVS